MPSRRQVWFPLSDQVLFTGISVNDRKKRVCLPVSFVTVRKCKVKDVLSGTGPLRTMVSPLSYRWKSIQSPSLELASTQLSHGVTTLGSRVSVKNAVSFGSGSSPSLLQADKMVASKITIPEGNHLTRLWAWKFPGESNVDRDIE
jgi:hypothetical protein